MDKENQIIAFKSLSSMIISLISVVGIMFTLLVYSIVSPSISSLEQNSATLLSSMVKLSNAVSYNANELNTLSKTNYELLSNMEHAVNNTYLAVKSSREFVVKMEKTTNKQFTNQTINLKQAEDELSELLIEIGDKKQSLSMQAVEPPFANNDLSMQMLKTSNELTLSISSLDLMFKGMTVVLILLFLSMILLSIEDIII